MKRYVCTVATGLLLALASTGTATAGILPLPAVQDGSQETSFGDQSVGEQKNDANVTQAQGNGNLNIAPSIAILGNAETTNAQGNGNEANAWIGQSNSAEQTQTSEQKQSLDQGGAGCCGGQSQTAEQKVYGADQAIGEQRNEADVEQWQGNGNVNVSPAIAILGNAETANYQGNGNEANAAVVQSNEATQSQSSTQKQYASQDGGSCCKPAPPTHGCTSYDRCTTKGYRYPKETCCKDGSSQTAEQKTSFGDQHVGEQRNEAVVAQKQGNGNVNVAPAIGLGGKKHDPCRSKCKGSWKPLGDTAETANHQGNGNEANAWVGQSNSAEQTQTSYQRQSLMDLCKGLVYR